MPKHPYNKDHYVVELHIGIDVFHKDYGHDLRCAKRAIDRLMSGDYSMLNEIRVWHGGCCVTKHEVQHPANGR